MTTSYALEMRKVTKTFAAHTAVSAISLDIPIGESVVVLGPSGCGKTTILRLIAGLETPDAGEVWLFGQRASAQNRNLLPTHQRGLGFVFQDLALWPHMTLHQHLDFVTRSAGLSKQGTTHAGDRDSRARSARRQGRSLSTRVIRRRATAHGVGPRAGWSTAVAAAR